MPKPREKVKQIRLWGRLFFNTKSFAPRQPIRRPLPKTSLISFLPFKCSSRLKRKEHCFSELIGLFLVRSSEFIASLGPAAFQYQPSAPCFHSGAKSEFTVSLNLTGLVSSFHNIFSSLIFFYILKGGNIRRYGSLGNHSRFNFTLFQNFLHLFFQILAVFIV